LNLRGQVLAQSGDLNGAAADFGEALKTDPEFLPALDHRIEMWMDNGRYAEALADMGEKLRRQPDDVATLRTRGALLAACPDRKLRDAKQAVADTRRACELTQWRDAESLSALAAVYAELDNFAQAIKWQKKALSLASSDVERTSLELYLEFYTKHERVESDYKSIVPVRLRR
jgi:tetratricopeptide (TPR) repeat protein